MLLIMTVKADHSTAEVIEWLLHSNTEFVRLNGDVPISNMCIEVYENGSINMSLFGADNSYYLFDKISKFWYRRGDLTTFKPALMSNKRQALRILEEEWQVLKKFIFFLLEERPHLGSLAKEENHNKLIDLVKAASAGLCIPQTLVTSKKESLQGFSNSITKAIKDIFLIHKINRIWAVETKQVEPNNLQILSNRVFPTLLQTEIMKSYELRVFFIAGEFYSMAIFSQSNTQTKVDFRNYDRNVTNHQKCTTNLHQKCTTDKS